MSAGDHMTRAPPEPAYVYKAFISYSHAADGVLAPALQQALERFATPWYRARSIRVFRDQTGLALTPHLWEEIRGRLERSEWFILLASPESARSEWVRQEVDYWLKNRAVDRFVIVLTGGEIDWPDGGRDFDWTRTNALPPALANALSEEPFWADLRWARNRKDVSLRRPMFAQEVARLVAALRGQSLEQVLDEDAARHASSMRLVYGAAALFLVVAVVSVFAAVYSWQAGSTARRLAAQRAEELRRADAAAEAVREAQRRSVLDQQAEARSAAIAGRALVVLKDDRDLAILLAVEAVRVAPTAQAEQALRRSLANPDSRPSPVRTFEAHAAAVTSVQFSERGRRLLTTGDDRSVRVWDPDDWANVQKFDPDNSDGSAGDVVNAVLNRDGTHVLTWTGPELIVGYFDRGSVRLFDAAAGSLLLKLPDRFAHVADLSPDGRRIITGGYDGAVRLYDASAKERPPKNLGSPADAGKVLGVIFSPDGTRALSAGLDGKVRIWDVASGAELADLAPEGNVRHARFTHDNKKVLTLATALEAWDWRSAPTASEARFSGPEGRVRTYALSRDDRWLVTGGDGTARAWDVATGKSLGAVPHPGRVHGVAVSPNGKGFVTVANVRLARVWEPGSKEPLMTLSGESLYTSVAFTPDGKRMAFGGSDGRVSIYDCPLLGSLDELLEQVRLRGLRQLTPQERQKHLGAPGG